jgi:hypothetical protein
MATNASIVSSEPPDATDTAPIPVEAAPSINLQALPDRERNRLRQLARSYRVRTDTTVRPVADVMFDLRLRHGVQLTMGQVFELLHKEAGQ